MSRHRRSRISTALAAGDPGKDLFAYLFLLIMVFSFMLLMSFEQAGSAQKSPDQEKSGNSSLKVLSKDNIATLVKQDARLLLKYGSILYDPKTDFDKLVKDKRVIIVTQKGRKKPQKFLYIEKKNQESISLFEYLETFQLLAQKNVSVAFAKQIL